jgi:hypothetical protein
MASPLTEASPPPTIRDVIGHDDDDGDNFIAEEEEEEDEDEDEEDEWDMSKRMSRLSMEGSDGGDADDEDGDDDEEEEEEEDDEFEVRSDVNGAAYGGLTAAPSSASLPGTPDRGAHAGARSPSSSPWWPGPSGGGGKGYASETEARWPPEGGRGGRRPWQQRRERMAREVWLERAWRLRKHRRQLQLQEAAVPVVVLGGGGGSPASSRGGGVAMDMEEVRACRDLGLDLPCDWTVEIPSHALSGVDTDGSGGNSPASGSWRISSPGNDPPTHTEPNHCHYFYSQSSTANVSFRSEKNTLAGVARSNQVKAKQSKPSVGFALLSCQRFVSTRDRAPSSVRVRPLEPTTISSCSSARSPHQSHRRRAHVHLAARHRTCHALHARTSPHGIARMPSTAAGGGGVGALPYQAVQCSAHTRIERSRRRTRQVSCSSTCPITQKARNS